MDMKRMVAIAAIGQKRKIGLANKLPWRNSKELAHFRDTTKDSILIMGRKTWDSIPKKHWQWRGRKVIVISKSTKGGNKNVKAFKFRNNNKEGLNEKGLVLVESLIKRFLL